MTTTKQATRTLKTLDWNQQSNCGTVQITAHGKTARYFVSLDGWNAVGEVVYLWSEFNRPISEAYHATESKCDCPAGRHGKACKHTAATKKLISLGVLS